MAKKKHKKKHSFQHKNAPTTVAAPAAGAKTAAIAKTTGKPSTMPNEWSEVRDDVSKTLVLGVIFIALMIGLWVLFEYTSVGPNLYNSIKL